MPRDRTNYGDSNTSDQSIGTRISEGGATPEQERQEAVNRQANRDIEAEDE